LPKLPRLNAKKAESLLLSNGFILVRSKGSHRIYRKGNNRMVLPFHAGKTLHPKIIKQLFDCIDDEY